MQYISASPGATTTWQVTPLTGSLSAGGLYLVGEAAGTGGTTGLPPTQASGSINMSGTSGTVALVDNSTPLTCKTAADCAADSDIVDLVGYGTAVIHEGSADAPGLSNTTSAQRVTTTDTDQNGTDFTAAAPTPGAPTAGGGGGGGGTPGPLAIHDIQGTGFLSPQNGNTVTNVPGIVTACGPVGSSKGYWIQDPSPDSNPATSEGIFVFTSSAPAVAPGDSVLVSGKVQEFYPLASGDTVATTSNLSVTEIDQTSASVVSQRQRAAGPDRAGSGHRARHLRARPGRRQHRVDRRSSPPVRPWTSTSRSRACGSRWTTPGSSGPRTPSASSTSPPSRTRMSAIAAAPC